MLSDKSITLLREELETRVKEYRDAGNTEHIKLDLDLETLHRILFKREGDSFEIAVSNDCLKTIDLTGISWEKVFVFDRDFEGTKGVCLNPQEVYNKNLSYANLKNVEINGNYDGVNIIGTNFTGAKGNLKIDPQKLLGKTIENAVLDGVEIIGKYDNVNIIGTNFKGVKGNLQIDLQKVQGKNAQGTILDGIEIIGNYDNVNIIGTDFTGAKGNLKINPERIRDGRLNHAILNGVTITGPIAASKICGADFTGSKDAIILVEDVEELERLTAYGTNLTDAKVIIEYNETMAAIDKAFSKQKTKNRKNG